ncbi:chaperone protein [Colletotrichum tofieldiae]|nr:chaperone protein [Colletotrichum tofieldiae]GKT72755.1 chaperone protein [Colletotrichum tofieldiae]
MQPPLIADYYVDLGIQQSATAQEIRQAYRALVMKHHPDKQGPGANLDAENFRKPTKFFETNPNEQSMINFMCIFRGSGKSTDDRRQERTLLSNSDASGQKTGGEEPKLTKTLIFKQERSEKLSREAKKSVEKQLAITPKTELNERRLEGKS